MYQLICFFFLLQKVVFTNYFCFELNLLIPIKIMTEMLIFIQFYFLLKKIGTQ